MKKRIKQHILLLGILFIFSSNLIAQEVIKKQLLSQIFEKIQKQHRIQFNFADDTINGIIIKPPSKDSTLKNKLEYLEKNTTLIFKVLDKNFVLVKPRQGFVLCGYLKDKDGSPLSQATIQGLKNAVVSNEKGFFQLEIASRFEPILIRYLGYQKISKPYNKFIDDDCGTIYMSPDFQSMSEIIISNYLTKGISKMDDGTFEINFSNFDILPGLIDDDVLQSVQAFPGIQSTNETVSNINIRGGTHDQNLILWDDIKMYQSGHFFGLISMFNPQITQKVSLIKNGSDVSFTDGVSGTISMKTDKKINTAFKGNIGVNLVDASGFIDMPINTNSSLQIAARKSVSDFFKTPTYDEFFDRISQDTEVENSTTNTINSDKEFDFYDATLRWVSKFSKKDEFRISFITVANELLFNENTTINEVSQSRQSNITQNSIAGSIFFNHIWNDNLQTSFGAYETDYKLKAINANILDAQRFLQENIVSETSLKLKINYQLNDNLQFLNGYHFVETKVTNLSDIDNPVFRTLISEVIRTHGAFTKVEYSSYNKSTNLNLGVRFNYIDKFQKIIWEPRLSFNQQFLTDFTFEILGEFKHQNTSQIINFQNDFLGIEKRRWQLANNDDIPVITSKQISTGINFNSSGWLVNIEGYYKNIEGITTQSQGFQNQYEFVKADGSYEVTGLDFLLKKKLGNLNTWLSYSYMNNLYTFDTLEAESFPSNYDITQAVTFGTTYVNRGLKLSAGLNWHSGKPTTSPIKNNEIINNEINFGPTNGAKLEEYLRIDVSALYSFKLGKKTNAKFGISVLNILDKKNEINNFYRINNNLAQETLQLSLGITPNAVFKIYL